MEPGTYSARAIGVEFGKSTKGTEQVGILFQVVDGPFTGQQITWYGSFSEKAAERTIQSLRSCGWTGNDVGWLAITDLPAQVDIVVAFDEFQGTRRLRVQWVNAPGVAMKQTLDQNERFALSKRLKGLCMSISAKSSGKPTSAEQQAPGADSTGDDDELPF